MLALCYVIVFCISLFNLKKASEFDIGLALINIICVILALGLIYLVYKCLSYKPVSVLDLITEQVFLFSLAPFLLIKVIFENYIN